MLPLHHTTQFAETRHSAPSAKTPSSRALGPRHTSAKTPCAESRPPTWTAGSLHLSLCHELLCMVKPLSHRKFKDEPRTPLVSRTHTCKSARFHCFLLPHKGIMLRVTGMNLHTSPFSSNVEGFDGAAFSHPRSHENKTRLLACRVDTQTHTARHPQQLPTEEGLHPRPSSRSGARKRHRIRRSYTETHQACAR